MAATIRLKRVGRKKQASFRIVVIDRAEGTAGPSVERLGIYNPRTEPSLIRLDAARALHWLREGATPSDSVRSLLRRTGVWEQFHQGVGPEDLEQPVVVLGPAEGGQRTSQRPAPETPSRRPRREVEPEEEAAAEEEAAPEAAAEGPEAEKAPATEVTDEMREASAATAEEESAVESEDGEESDGSGEAEEADEGPTAEAEDETEEAGEAEEEAEDEAKA